MAENLTAEKLAQRALDVNILNEVGLRDAWNELGTRNVELEQLQQVLLRRGLLTNYQIDRLLEGFRNGFFYGDYKVLYGVGAGTFARVYRATHRETNELFAVKVLRKRFSSVPKEAELFRREGELGSALKHPNIVAIHDVVSKGSVHYLVMDFVEGNNLRDFFKVRRKFAPLEASRIIVGMLAGLNYAFQQGVTHRDLKMSNVIVSSDGDSKLVDFGLAGLGGTDGDDVGDGMNPRTIDYAGLERATNVRRDDTRSDIFFTGCIFYQLLSGKAAIAETRDKVQRLSKDRYQNIPSLLKLAPELPLGITRVVNKALEFDPDKRYQTPGEMLTDLKLAAKRIELNKDDPEEVRKKSVRLEGHDPEGHPRKLMVVESEVKMQDLFRKLFKKCGYRVLVTNDPQRLFERFYADQQTAEILLISSGHIGRGALDAFSRLSTEPCMKDLPAVILLGDQHVNWKPESPQDDHRVVVRMPIKSRALREAVLQAVGKNPSLASG
jgi:serine/threonine protein kinase